ncbi:MAG: polysaccharide biosynthesis/export family protein [Paludibacteraceae bacterium]|nr:polysaccharide biosynthesis/export family protein [Paludibacteraceae bacterium]
MGKKRNIFFLAIVGFLLASCVTAKKVNYMQEPGKDKIPSYADTLAFADYQLRIGDRIYIYVYSVDDRITKMYNSGSNSSQMRSQMNSGNTYGSYELYSYLVDDEGNIDFPTIGKVPVRGLTTREVKHVIEDELSQLMREMPGYKTVSVEVNVVQRTFSVIGMQSGRYPITKEKMTIFEALATIGDIQEFGSRHEVKLIREIEGKSKILTFDVRSKDIVNSEYYYIEPNDIIYIRYIPGYAFGINSAATTLGIVSSTISFGVFIYSIVQTGINHVNKHYGGK